MTRIEFHRPPGVLAAELPSTAAGRGFEAGLYGWKEARQRSVPLGQSTLGWDGQKHAVAYFQPPICEGERILGVFAREHDRVQVVRVVGSGIAAFVDAADIDLARQRIWGDSEYVSGAIRRAMSVTGNCEVVGSRFWVTTNHLEDAFPKILVACR